LPTYIREGDQFDCMILGYRDKRTEAFSKGAFVRDFQGFAAQAYKRLEILGTATSLEDLLALPSNRLEVLRDKRAGQFSVRIDQQWRLCFKWPHGTNGPSDAEIVGYH
jgi:toxin HigB-1